MSKLVLYMAPASPPSRSVMMLAHMLGVQLQCKMVNLVKMEHRKPEFRKLNPLCLVPVLEDGDFILSDSHAILKYLVTSYGGEQQEALYPRAAQARAVVDQRLFFNASVFFKNIGTVAIPSFQGKLKGPTQQHIDNIEEAFNVIEEYLQNSLFVAADRLTIADLSLGATATATQIMYKIDAKRHPRGAEWLGRLQKDPVFQNINAPGVEYLSKLLNSFWKKNQAA